MNNNYLNINLDRSSDNNLDTIIDKFLKKIDEITLDYNLINMTEEINKLIDSLIDICIKNKINYFVKNHISFSSIKSNFKIEFENSLIEILQSINSNIEKNLLNVSFNNIKNIKLEKDWKKLFLHLCKNNDNKNRVSFNPTATQYIYDTIVTDKKAKKKTKTITIEIPQDDNSVNELEFDKKVGIYIKIIFDNATYVDILRKNIYRLCLVINDENSEYDILNPYKK